MLHHLTKRQKVIVMGAVMSGLFLAALDQTIVSTALPKILTEFDALKELTWVVTAYLLTSTIATPISGKLSDLYGRRILLLVGIVIFAISSLLCGIAQDINQLIAFRALQGIGGGILMANAFAIIGDLFDARERGRWQGIIGGVFGLAALAGPLLGGYLTDGHQLLGLMTDWRWTFLINIPVAAVSFVLIAKYMPRIVTRKNAVIDYLGAGLLALALACIVLAASLGGTDGWAWDSAKIIGLIIGGIVSTIGFIVAERRAQEPILPLHFFKNSIFNVVSILFLLFGMAFFGAIVYIPAFAQQVLQFSATNAGIIMLPMVLGLTAGSVVIGQMVHKTGKYKMFVVAGLAITTVGIWALSTLTAQTDYMGLAWRMLLTGIGLGMAMPIFSLAVQNALPQKDLGVATSSVQLFRSIGGTVGLAIMGSIINNVLVQKLANLSDEPFVKIAQQQGQGQFASADINTIQGVLSPEAQAATLQSLQQLPPQAQHAAVDAFNHFIATLQGALASSITYVFFLSALVMFLAFLISFALKEKPLAHHKNVIPTE